MPVAPASLGAVDQYLSPRKPRADSIAAASGATGYSVAFLRRLKAAGCPAFVSGRVDLDALEAYVKDNGLEDKGDIPSELEAIKIAIAQERLRSIRHDNELKEGKAMRKEEVCRAIEVIGRSIVMRLRELEDKWPAMMQGKSAAELQPIVAREVDGLCEYWSEEAMRWSR